MEMNIPTKENVPTKEGFYWARWLITKKESSFNDWKVVEVFIKSKNKDGSDNLLVFIGGVEKPQSLESFLWGPLNPLISQLRTKNYTL